MKLSSSYFSKKYQFIKANSFNLFLLSNQKHPLYHTTFQIAILAKFPVQFNSICILCCHCLHRFLKFSGNHFDSVMSNSQRLRIDTCYFHLGKLIHFKIKMFLSIDYLSYYLSKWQFAYLDYLCDIEWSRIYFQICLFSSFKYLKIAWAYWALPPPRNPTRSFNPRSCQETNSASWIPYVLRMYFVLPKFWFFSNSSKTSSS